MNSTSMKFRARLVFPALAVLVATNSPASAQMINYGRLQDIFQEPVTTSATGTPQRASDVAADMTIITADQIRQSGSRSVPEIVGIYTPGVNVMQEGINTFDVGMRGYQQPYNPRLLVLIDGRQVFSYDYSRTQWDNLPLNVDDIRQIEVVKGASSALFGSNATSGVINIITYSPLYDKNSVATAVVGTQHDFEGDATYTQKFGSKGGIKLSAGGVTEHEFSGTATEYMDYKGALHPFHQYMAASGAFKVTPAFAMNGEASVSQKKSEEVIPDFTANMAKTTSYAARAGWSWNSPFGTLKNDNYVNQNILKYSAGIGDPANLTTFVFSPGQSQTDDSFTNNSLVVSRLEDLFDVGADHTFRLMLEYRHKYFIDSVAMDAPLAYVPQKPILNQNIYTAGGTWLWHVRDDLTWTNAIRYDANYTDSLGGLYDTSGSPAGSPYPTYTKGDFKRDFGTVSANSGLVYNLSKMDTLRATYGRGVQDPSLINTAYNFSFWVQDGVVFQAFSNPDIKPTIVQDWSLGYDRKIPDIYSTAHVTAFYETNRDMIGPLEPYLDMSGGYAVITQYQGNIGNSQGFGGEVSLDGHSPDGFRWNASYSYARLHDGQLTRTLANYERSAPRTQLRLNVGKTIGNWELDGHGQYASSSAMLRTTDDLTSVASPYFVNEYYTLGGRIGYRITDNVTASLYGSNLQSMRTRMNPYTVQQRRLFLSLSGRF